MSDLAAKLLGRVGREKPPTLEEAVDLVIEASYNLPLDTFYDAPDRWKNKLGGLLACLSILASARGRKR